MLFKTEVLNLWIHITLDTVPVNILYTVSDNFLLYFDQIYLFVETFILNSQRQLS